MENNILSKKKILIVGCGGLGGFVIEELSRYGVGTLYLCDGDIFDKSNLNRQLMASDETLGRNKAEVCCERVEHISNTKAVCLPFRLTEENADIMHEVDIVIDCVDKISTRKFLAIECQKRNKILIHGAVEKETGQIMVCFPDDNIMTRLYGESKDKKKQNTVSYAVATIASVQTAVAVSVLLGRAERFKGKLILIDLKNFDTKMVVI